MDDLPSLLQTMNEILLDGIKSEIEQQNKLIFALSLCVLAAADIAAGREPDVSRICKLYKDLRSRI